jgi:hypothetical protein
MQWQHSVGAKPPQRFQCCFEEEEGPAVPQRLTHRRTSGKRNEGAGKGDPLSPVGCSSSLASSVAVRSHTTGSASTNDSNKDRSRGSGVSAPSSTTQPCPRTVKAHTSVCADATARETHLDRWLQDIQPEARVGECASSVPAKSKADELETGTCVAANNASSWNHGSAPPLNASAPAALQKPPRDGREPKSGGVQKQAAAGAGISRTSSNTSLSSASSSASHLSHVTRSSSSMCSSMTSHSPKSILKSSSSCKSVSSCSSYSVHWKDGRHGSRVGKGLVQLCMFGESPTSPSSSGSTNSSPTAGGDQKMSDGKPPRI